ncbi:ATP-dependent DNA helicase PIF1 [Paramuricea clavata]|uniref:ATP-dependent DNA helicase n=1 Tax=Paramuricea clavata TaxID=317549 RepID=A0A7D9JPN6_PARCT|nr:ATP-dependent DNA helicase PIF1 [Paramuricea clavata]
MIRQLGPASLFCSFSSAETKWIYLLRILGKLIDHKDYSDEELDNLTWEEKCRLIQSDPVTCARHFDYQFNTFLKEFLMSNIAPLGQVKDWFYRVEYQQRGSPHIHMLIWLQNTPVFGVDKDEDITAFIDQIITCCKPKGKDITFDQLLEELDISEHEYILVIRSSLNCPTIFLKRSPNELRINNYNSACLHAWRANMDIQFVLDVYACAMYIVSYISKAQKGMSELLRKACAEAKEGNANIKQQVRDIGNKFLNSVEISAQEAVYVILQLPMRKSSRSVIFVNTSPPAERVELLKPLSEIEKMSDESEEIHSSGLLKRYVERPDILQNVTLADWAAWYDSCGKHNYKKSDKKADIDNLPVETEDGNNDDELFNELENPSISVLSNKSIKKRSQARIIRSVWFNKEAHLGKHYRELIMLFTPWRNEQTDLIGCFSSFQEHYLARYDEISEQMKQYAVCSEDLNEIHQHLQECDDDMYDTIAPVTQHTELQDQDEGNTDTHPDLNENYDLSADLGIPSTLPNNEPLVLNEMQDDEYRGFVQMLNKKQREFFYHVLHLIKTSDKPFYYAFLSGSGGVGKSHVIKSIYQAGLKYYNSKAGEDFHRTQILLLAPTGKAAYLIKGNTIHSALAIPASQSPKNYKPLDSGRLNTLRCQLGALKLILLDEISMVGNSMFTIQLNNRLKDLKGSKEDFDSVSIITIGDFFQLKPVMDGYIFTDVQSLSSYNILVPNLWKKYFKMFELDEIMRQRESKMFAEILNRLREGNHTSSDLEKLKERCVEEPNCPKEALRLFVQNALVDSYNEKVFESFSRNKYTIKAQDSVIGACSPESKEKIMRQIPYVSLRNSKQLAHKLKLAVGQRTEIAINVRTVDGLTNGASNVIRLIQLNNESKPSGIVWVQFDYEDVGRKTRQENRSLYSTGIESTWTPIKPVTSQFAVGKTKSAQVVRKQFPLRPASAKTVHRSQGDTQTQIVVNLNTNRAIPHIHYVALSRVTTIEGLHITDLCEHKISVDQSVVKEMQTLRTEDSFKLCFTCTFISVGSI